MTIGLETYKHVLPRARAWRITIDKQLRQFFVGVSDAPADVQAYQDGVWNDYRPFETTKLDEWDDQFGLLPTAAGDAARRDRLDAAWKALGGQSPRYLQDTVQAAGFDVYIHEWWFPSLLPTLTPRDPGNYISVDGTGSFVLTQLGRSTSQLGGPSATLGRSRLLGELLTSNPDPVEIPSDPTLWPFFLYWGAATFPDMATVDADREAEFKTLLLKLCPAQQWLGLLVEFT